MKEPNARTEQITPQRYSEMGMGHGCLASVHRVRSAHSMRGFSMVEMAVTLGMVLVLSAITIPALIPAYTNYRLSWQATTLSSLVQRARYAAVKRNSNVSVNLIPGGTAACPAGMQCVFVDENNNATYDVGESMVALPSDITILPAGTAPGPASTGYAAAVPPGWPVTFNSRGTVSSGGAATIYIVYLGNPAQPSWGYRAVTITPMGQVKPWAASNNSTWHNL